jgi:hypothetical protein
LAAVVVRVVSDGVPDAVERGASSGVVGERRESRQGLQTFEVDVAVGPGRVVIRG